MKSSTPTPPSPRPRRPAEPLVTRHVFLDTQVFRALGHNPANRAMALLKDQVVRHRVALHTTDITLLEVKRQIHERVVAHKRELDLIEKDLVRWRKGAPKSAPKHTIVFDAEALSAELFKEFDSFLRRDCGTDVHSALSIDPRQVFQDYFDREPPFDGEESKEFPDGFVLAALAQWCRDTKNQIYVVTEDKAMLRAVLKDEWLLSLKDIHDVLARAAADLGAAGETAAETALNGQDFDGSFLAAMRLQVKEVTFIYAGDLPDGEAYEGELIGVEAISDWSVVGLNDRLVSLILDVNLKVRVEIQYEDRDGAFYDKEDGRWYGAEIGSTEIEDGISAEVLVEVDRSSGFVRDAKILDQEITIYGPSDWI